MSPLTFLSGATARMLNGMAAVRLRLADAIAPSGQPEQLDNAADDDSATPTDQVDEALVEPARDEIHEQLSDGPPEHWLERVRAQNPPAHWLEDIQKRLANTSNAEIVDDADLLAEQISASESAPHDVKNEAELAGRVETQVDDGESVAQREPHVQNQLGEVAAEQTELDLYTQEIVILQEHSEEVRPANRMRRGDTTNEPVPSDHSKPEAQPETPSITPLLRNQEPDEVDVALPSEAVVQNPVTASEESPKLQDIEQPDRAVVQNNQSEFRQEEPNRRHSSINMTSEVTTKPPAPQSSFAAESSETESPQRFETLDVGEPARDVIKPISSELPQEDSQIREQAEEIGENREVHPVSQLSEAEDETGNEPARPSLYEQVEQEKELGQIERPQGELVAKEAVDEGNAIVVPSVVDADYVESSEPSQNVPTFQSRRDVTSPIYHEANAQVSEARVRRSEPTVRAEQERTDVTRSKTPIPSKRAVRIRPVPTKVEQLTQRKRRQEEATAASDEEFIRRSDSAESIVTPSSQIAPVSQPEVNEPMASNPTPLPTAETVNVRNDVAQSSISSFPQSPVKEVFEARHGVIRRQPRSFESDAPMPESVDVGATEASPDPWPELPKLAPSEVSEERLPEESALQSSPYYRLPAQNDEDSLDDDPNYWPRLPQSHFMMPEGDDWQAESRARKRIKRLDEEQRGVLWNESPF